MIMEITKSEILMSTFGATSDTLPKGPYDSDSGVKDFSVQTTFSVRSAIFFLRTFLRAARHPADSDGRPTAGAQVLARVPVVPWHCRVPCSPFVLVFIQKHRVQACRSFLLDCICFRLELLLLLEKQKTMTGDDQDW